MSAKAAIAPAPVVSRHFHSGPRLRGNERVVDMKDLSSLMQQAQAMQQKLQEAQAKLAETSVEGSAGGGMVKVVLKGSGELRGVVIDEALFTPGEGEVLSDLIVAAHADAKRKLDAAQADAMKSIAGPLAGLPGFPKF
jgi:DNA-binding YbaB/EbfC family protein